MGLSASMTRPVTIAKESTDEVDVRCRVVSSSVSGAMLRGTATFDVVRV